MISGFAIIFYFIIMYYFYLFIKTQFMYCTLSSF